MSALVWIQREFRIDYLPALQQALQNHSEVVVAYFHDPDLTLGEANSAWLSKALQNLQAAYEKRNGRLNIVNGSFETKLAEVIQSYQVEEVLYSFQVGMPFIQQQQTALRVCEQNRVGLTPFYSEDFFQADQVVNKSGQAYKVFTPYYKNAMQLIHAVEPLELTQADLSATAKIKTDDSNLVVPQDLVEIENKAWAKKLMKHWQVGESAAWEHYETFSQLGLAGYDEDRDYPAIDATSKLSPYLHFGHINPRSIYFSLLSQQAKPANYQAWVRQLFWRSFARYLLVWFADKERQPFNDKYSVLAWDHLPEKLQAWQKGRTGIPIIDAGMRELWETGFMHNRVRMLVASILSKNLNIDWLHGMDWFADTLVDADPANNSMGWQWVAGCGVDAAPYYRLFNPLVQSKKIDAHGDYIKRWVPELTGLSAKAIHEPWKDLQACKQAGVKLGEDYPLPIVDIDNSRQAHVERVNLLKTA